MRTAGPDISGVHWNTGEARFGRGRSGSQRRFRNTPSSLLDGCASRTSGAMGEMVPRKISREGMGPLGYSTLEKTAVIKGAFTRG